MKRSAAKIVREYGPFPGTERVHGVTYDGQQVWFASGDKLNALDPSSGQPLRSIDVPAHAGTAFDGRYLFQIAEDTIQKIDPETGRALATIPSPGGGRDSGLAWAEGSCGWASIGTARSIRSILIPARFFAPSGRAASSLESPGWRESCGTGRGKVTKAICGESIRGRARSWSSSICRPVSTCRAWNAMAAINSSAVEGPAGR